MLLVADPVGHLAEDDELPGRAARDVGERLLADVEGPLLAAGVVGQHEPARAHLDDLRGVHQVAHPPSDELPTGPARERDGGRVDVDDPLEGVEDEDGVGHALDHRAAGQGGQVDEALLEQPPHQQPAGEDERERRQVDEREPADLEVVQDVGRPGQQRRAQQHQGHPTVGPGQPHHAGDEQHRRADEQQVVVGEDRPEHRPRLDVREVLHPGRRGVGAHQVVRGRHREDGQRSDRRYRQQRHQTTGDQLAPTGVLQHEDQPGGRERDDADVLQVAPPGPDHRRAGGELHGVRGPPPRHGDEQHRQAPAHGRAPAPGDIAGQRSQHQSGAGHQGREQRQHPKPPALGLVHARSRGRTPR